MDDLYLEKELALNIGKDEMHRLYSYPECQLEFDFLGFLESYNDLKDIIPKDFTIIDLGCYQALQGYYFKNHKEYIGIDNYVPIIWRFHQNNAKYYYMSIQDFIKEHINELDLSKTFAICSYVPDIEARTLVRNTFSYYRDIYCNEKFEVLPM